MTNNRPTNFSDIAEARRWRVRNYSPRGGEITIAGWFFGGEPDAPVALLHHANGMCGALWALVAERLRGTYRVYAVDARGHGDSDHLRVPEDYAWDYFVDDLCGVTRQVLHETGCQHIGLGLGSSFGGIITAAAAARHPDLYARLVMLDPPILPSAELLTALDMSAELPASAERESLAAQTLKRRATWPSRQAARDAWQGKPLFAPWQPRAFDLYLEQGMRDLDDGSGEVTLKCALVVEAHIFQTTGSLGVFDYAPQVQVPVQLVHAAQGFFPEMLFQRLATLFPQGEFQQLQGGHMLPLEVPDLVADFLLSDK